jgi:hypothetical protein
MLGEGTVKAAKLFSVYLKTVNCIAHNILWSEVMCCVHCNLCFMKKRRKKAHFKEQHMCINFCFKLWWPLNKIASLLTPFTFACLQMRQEFCRNFSHIQILCQNTLTWPKLYSHCISKYKEWCNCFHETFPWLKQHCS